MKSTILLLSICFTGLGLYWVWDSTRYQQPEPHLPFFDSAQLLELKPFGEWNPDLHYTQDLSLVFYFSELSCQTCTTRELENVAQWHQQYGQRIDFYLVVQGQDPVYLNNLKRLAKVKYPILIEENLGHMGFHQTTIALFRKSTQEICALYFPLPEKINPKELTRFQERLVKELGVPVPKGAKRRDT